MKDMQVKKEKTVYVSLRISKSLYEKILQEMKNENRTKSNVIITILKKHFK